MAAPPPKGLSVIYPPISMAMAEQAPSRSPGGGGLTGFAAAPMPDQDAAAPRASVDGGPAVGPTLFRSNAGFRGDGFTPDSSPQISQQSKHISLPGIAVKLPLY